MDPKPIRLQQIKSLCVDKDSNTNGFQFLRTAYKVKDPRVSIKFYNGLLGMTLMNSLDLPSMKSTFYSLGYVTPSEMVPSWTDGKARDQWAMTRSSVIELMHEWGTENQKDFQINSGIGFLNISLMVPDVHSACRRLESLGVEFIKKPNDGNMKGIAFFKDPDGYQIEIYDSKAVQDNI